MSETREEFLQELQRLKPVQIFKKDATIEKIVAVKDHPNADRLDLVQILGYQCVAQKGLYVGGETIVYIKPDSVLPEEPWAESWKKLAPSRIRAIKLRDEWSEGIIVPFDLLPAKIVDQLKTLSIGDNVSELLNIQHYVPKEPQDLDALSSKLPYGIGPTDEERFENFENNLPFSEYVDVQLKIDGTSASYYYDVEEKKFGVLARNQEMKLDKINMYTNVVKKYALDLILKAYCERENVSMVLRGEIFGAGVQSTSNNPHSKLKEKDWAMFSVYLFKERKYAHKGHKYYFKNVASDLGLPIAPMIEENVILTHDLLKKYSTDLSKLNNQSFEGVVIKHSNGSFKVLNKSYDSKK